jgi:hypothetical protein
LQLLVCSCLNKPNNNIENLKTEFKAYFNTHSYALILSVDESDACEICVMQILNRLSYVKNDRIQIFVDGLSDNSDLISDFKKVPLSIKHANEVIPCEPFLCIVDSTLNASHYFVPEMDQPHVFEQYLQEVMPMIRENK